MRIKISNSFKNRNVEKITFVVWLIITVFLALFPRSVDVLNQNPIFGFDQGRDYLAVKDIVVNRKFTLIGAEVGAGFAGIYGVFQGPFYYYLLSIPFVIFSGNPVGGVVLMLFLGLTTIAFAYYFANKIFGKWTALLLAFLVSTSPFLISQSRFIWNPNSPTLFVLLSFYFVYNFYKRKYIYLFLASFFAGLVYNFEFAVFVPLSISIFLYGVFYFGRAIKNILILILGFLFALTPMFLFEFKHNFIGFNGIISYIFSHKSIDTSYFYQQFMIDHAKSFIYSFQGAFPFDSFIFSVIFFIILLGLSIYLVIKKNDKALRNFIIFLLLLLPVNIFIFSFLKNTVWVYYLTDLTLAYIFLFSYIYFRLWQRKNLILNTVLVVFILTLGIVAIARQVKMSINDYRDFGGNAKIKGKIAALDYIYKDSRGKPFGLFVFTPPIYTYAFDYLIWWHGKNKYRYVPYKEKKGQFYLLIEVDQDKPWRHKGWMETVIKTGRIEYTKTLPTNFILQKRVE